MELNRNVLLPNLLTIGNGICGFVALATLTKVQPDTEMANAQQLYSTAAWLVFLGMVFDVFDGKVARVSGGSTALGAQLDSLCDLVTFGLVPAFLIMQMNLGMEPPWDKFVTVFSLAYFLGATLRLARFTAENSPDESAHLAFKGLPTPGAAGCVASLVIFHSYIADFAKPELVWLARYVSEDTLKVAVVWIREVMPFLGLFLGFAMVSNRLVFDHAGSWVFGKKHSFDFFAYVIFGTVLAAVIPEVVLPVVFFGYLFYKPSLLLVRFILPAKKVSVPTSQSEDLTNEGKGVSVIVGLGSNLGDRNENMGRALDLLRELAGVNLLRKSSFRETDPVGGPAQGKYLNAVVEVETMIVPRELLARFHEIEAVLGRVRTVRDGPRPIDLDILLYGDETIKEPGLEIPHPRMLEREFVLEPLAELVPDRRHPLTGNTMREHWRACRESARGETRDGEDGG